MTPDALIVFALIAIAGVVMATGRVRLDIVALLVVVALMLSGILTVGESLAGFGSPVVILVACLLVVGEMLARTGVAAKVGSLILERGGNSEWRLLVLIMVAAAALGALMSSTAVVAIFIPVILRIATDTGISSSRLLLPMAYAALISGMLTLIATTPNIVVHEELKSEGYEGFGFFGFTAIGAVVLAVAIGYMLLVGRRMLDSELSENTSSPSARSLLDLWRSYNDSDDFCRARVSMNSPLVGQTLEEAGLEAAYGLRIVGIEPANAESGFVTFPSSSTRYERGDVLVLVGPEASLVKVVGDQGLDRLSPSVGQQKRWFGNLGAASVLVHPDSGLVGRSIKDIGFHEAYRLQVLGMRRGTEIVESHADEPLAAGDGLFVVGPWSRIQGLGEKAHDFIVLEMPSEIEDILPASDKMPIALGILAGMVLLMVFDIVPVTAAVLIASLAAVATRCLSMEDAYRSIHWSSIVLIAGMLPLADALTVTGGTQLIVDSLLDLAGDSGPYAMFTILFFLTAGLGLVLSNTASAVLVAPIAIYAAREMDVSPYPFAMAVLIAASAAYSTPVSTPVVTLVVDPGRYKFVDFMKLGIPLLLLTYLATMLVAPLIFPF